MGRSVKEHLKAASRLLFDLNDFQYNYLTQKDVSIKTKYSNNNELA